MDPPDGMTLPHSTPAYPTLRSSMTTQTPTARGSLDEYLADDDLVAVPQLTDAAWDAVRRDAGRAVAWRFCTPRNLVVHRGRFAFDAMGFAWGGVFRTLLVGPIVTTSYRNEGHFRAGERIHGTSDFFYGSFVLPKSGEEFREIVRLVNLRHHVAGVVLPDGVDRVRVRPGYEADFAYVATAFIESIRRGLAVCGLPPRSRGGRRLAEHLCTILYQLAGFTGLTRMPRDLAAHEQFCAAYDRRLRACPPSSRVRRMAQEIAHRIAPTTAFMAGDTVRGHVLRHIDPETREFLFPGDEIPPELERRRDDLSRSRRGRQRTLADIERVSRARQALVQRPDVSALQQAYRRASGIAGGEVVDDRLIGAVLLYALDASDGSPTPLERRTIDLAAGEPLIRQGDRVDAMLVVLSSTAPLVVLHAAEAAQEPRQVASLAAPTVLGEIGMWRGQPAVATVLSPQPNRLEVIVIDHARFEALKHEPGFRAAAAAEVQRRLSLNSALVHSLLDDAAAAAGDPRLTSLAQLFRFLSGDSHGRLDAVLDLPDEATPAECLDGLRHQLDAALKRTDLAPDLIAHLEQIASTIG